MASEYTRTQESAILAEGVSVEEFMQQYAGQHCEWIAGRVIRMSPASLRHQLMIDYLSDVLRFYFTFTPIGQRITAPFVMLLPDVPARRREPDIQVILESNPGALHDTYMEGPADICIEVVSPESNARDHGEKFDEYERGGVPEYWIVDPIRRECRFYRRGDDGVYLRQTPDADDNYTTPALPGLKLHVPTLWQDVLPDPVQTLEAVRAMTKR